MASLLKQVLTLLGHAAGDAAGDALDRALKPETTVGGPGTAAGPAEDPAPDAPRRSADATARQDAHRTTQAGGRGAPPGRTSRGVGTRTGAHEGVTVYDVAARGLPDFTYSPDPDGEADPGEVVWTWVPYEEDASQGKDRPVLVLARQGTGPSARLVVSQMTSQDHDLDAAQEAHWGRYWHDVGTGAWDSQGRPSEVRLDRLLLVNPEAVRREGATMDRRTFDSVVSALREHWG
ncbi:type II toxin-antitoxin system PemK/MazF family toxin [Actinomyces sp. HMT897]|mgnify:FL=1|uniref:type II toxin-antitoxin system PemK/MazF family toxin n=1 Tax=Actinomyces sp. HMT897 TaxID=2789424 RepID=UPI00190D0913|nr:type II toxin-antitoxin system PemK/MazF family toxin [Actinomyces sp. HMT897]QQO78107.1 type II toxin-antitoxin system PemK/MazF family toxin [Actinomyces sp. HMT897]